MIARAARSARRSLRARRVELVLTDCDGVLTDGTVYCSARRRGAAALLPPGRDGLRAAAGGRPGTRPSSPGSARPSSPGAPSKLGVPLHAGVNDKVALVAQLLEERRPDHRRGGLHRRRRERPVESCSECGRTGLTGAPADAEPPVRAVAHFVSARPGGQRRLPRIRRGHPGAPRAAGSSPSGRRGGRHEVERQQQSDPHRQPLGGGEPPGIRHRRDRHQPQRLARAGQAHDRRGGAGRRRRGQVPEAHPRALRTPRSVERRARHAVGPHDATSTTATRSSSA